MTHIREILYVFHRAQELLSSERTPTLSLALPAYEILLQILRLYISRNIYPHLNFALTAAITKLEKYVELARQNTCYGLSMLLNPTSKMAWMEKHWTKSEVDACRQKAVDAMLAYVKAERTCADPNMAPQDRAFPFDDDCAANRLGAGFRGLESILASLSQASSSEHGPVVMDESNPAPSLANTQEQDAMDNKKVEAELLLYISEPLHREAMTTTTLMGWWNIHRYKYPLLWKVARDILPAQASSVPCERVFSSSKQTTSPQRNALSPQIVEKLQVLKFGLKQDQLDFTRDWIKRPEEMIGGTDHYDNEV